MKKSHLEFRYTMSRVQLRVLSGDVPPSGMAKLALHTVEDTGCDQGAERVTDQTATREDRGAHAEFRALVPLREQEQRAGEERGLHKTEEEAREEGTDEAIVFWSVLSHECRCAENSLVRYARKCGNHTPDDHTAWEVDRGLADVVQEHVPRRRGNEYKELRECYVHLRGNLHENVSDVKDTEQGVEFLVLEVEIILEAS